MCKDCDCCKCACDDCKEEACSCGSNCTFFQGFTFTLIGVYIVISVTGVLIGMTNYRNETCNVPKTKLEKIMMPLVPAHRLGCYLGEPIEE